MPGGSHLSSQQRLSEARPGRHRRTFADSFSLAHDAVAAPDDDEFDDEGVLSFDELEDDDFDEARSIQLKNLSALQPLLGGEREGHASMASLNTEDRGNTRKSGTVDGDTVVAGFAHHAEAVWETGGSYGPRGFKGLFASNYVVLCAAFSALGGLLFGYDQGVVSVILVMPQFLQRFTSVAENAPGSGFWKGLLTAMIELGAVLGALNQGWIADKLSRKYSIVVAVVIFTVGSILQTAAVNYAMLTIARLIGGVGIGMLSMVVPLYISEISPPEIRGTLLVLEEFSIVTGIVIAFWITYGTRFMAGEWSWRLPFLLQMIPGFVLGVGILFLPFSPRWLVAQGRDDEALRALAKLRQLPTDDKRVRQEWYDIRAEVAFHREVSVERHPKLQDGSLLSRVKLEFAGFGDCFKPGCWRRTHVGVGLMFFQQFVGINALIYYSPTLFKTMGLNYDMQLIMSGVLNVTQLIGVSSSIWSMDRLGRRPLLLTGSALMCICHVIISVLVGLYDKDWPSHRLEGWVSVAMLLFYMLAFGASWGPVPWAMPSEVFPSSLRAKGVAMSTASSWLNNFIIVSDYKYTYTQAGGHCVGRDVPCSMGLITPPLVQNTGFGAYTFFAVFCLLSLLWTWFFVPETNGRTLEQMDQLFNDASGEQDEARRMQIEAEIVSSSAGGRVVQANSG